MGIVNLFLGWDAQRIYGSHWNQPGDVNGLCGKLWSALDLMSVRFRQRTLKPLHAALAIWPRPILWMRA